MKYLTIALKNFLGKIRFEIICKSLRRGHFLFANILCLEKWIFRDDFFLNRYSYPEDIRKSRDFMFATSRDLDVCSRLHEKFASEDHRKRGLFLMNSSMYGGDAQNPIFKMLQEAAASSFSRSLLVSAETPTAHIDALIREEKISHVFLYLDGESSERLASYLRRLKHQSSITVSVFILDPHHYGSFDQVVAVLDFADLIYPTTTWVPGFDSEILRDKLRFRSLTPVRTNPHTIPFERREFDISFSGLEKAGRLECLLGLGRICRRNGVKTYINLMSLSESYNAPSSDRYQELIANSVAVLNLSVRTRNSNEVFDILNGRSLEALAFGCLLVEYKPKSIPMLSLEHYFNDGEHFLTFSSFEELEVITKKIVKREPHLLAIAKNGNARYVSIFQSKNVLDELLIDFESVPPSLASYSG